MTLLITACSPVGARSPSQGEVTSSMPSTPGSSLERPTLGKLKQPSAEMIQFDTVPPYGDSMDSRPTGMIGSVGTEVAESKGLASGGYLNSDYATLQNMYRMILLPRLVAQLKLSSFDQQLVQHGPSALSRNALFYLYAQSCAGVDLSYLIIRNNLYVERLEKEQIDLFLAHAADPNFASDPTLNQIVTDTYMRVVRLVDEDGDFLASFDSRGGMVYFNDAIIVMLAYTSTNADYDANGNFTAEFRQQIHYLHAIVQPALQAELQKNWPGHINLLAEFY